MPNHFYLPQLTDANLSTPGEHGHWFNNEKKIILGISDAILVDDNALTKGVSSIPDIWARPLLFQSAIKQRSKHPLRKRCIQEWRGLMSLIALHKIVPDLGALEFEPVVLNTETLSTALKNLAPTPIQLERDKFYDWTNILMIRFNGIPLGAFSPSTLVFTGTDYSKRLPKEFPYKDENGYLRPPLNIMEGIENVGEWLMNLQSQLQPFFYSSQENPHHSIITNINDLIEEWLIEIRRTLNLAEGANIDASRYKVSEEVIDIAVPVGFLREYNIYKQLLKPLIAATNNIEQQISDVELISTRKLKGFKHVIIINEKLLEEDIYLWGETRSQPLGDNPKTIINTYFNKPSGTTINIVPIGDGDNNGIWIRPELYFLTDDILKAGKDDILSNEEQELNLSTRYILPFKKEILDFYSPREVKDILKPAYKEDNGIVKFSFILPLVGNKSIKIEKTYRSRNPMNEEGKITETDVPIIEIFPNYLGINWRRYYLFQGQSDQFKVTPLFGGNNVSVNIKSREAKYLQNGETLAYTSTLIAKEKEVKYTQLSQGIIVSEISGDNCFPEGLSILNGNDLQMGLIMLGRTESHTGLNNTWTIGIDFGTSNTNVFKKRGEDDPAERWIYNFPEYSRSITISSAEIKKVILQEHFFPTQQVHLPIPTTLKMYNSAIHDNMVLDYFIYYPIEYKFPAEVLSDIKWEGEGERKTEYFLGSLMFLLLIEVVRENVALVHLACSYPKAFSQINIDIFKREWEAVLDKLMKKDIDNVNPILHIHRGNAEDNGLKVKIEKPVFKTEGIAAGEYFANRLTIPDIRERAHKEIAAICLDVGGGTTDISIWYLNNIEFDASVLLAGRQISNLIQKNSRVRELLFTKEAAIALEEKQNEAGYFSARLNLILKNEETRIQENLVRHANNKDIKWLRQIIALEFGALSFFAAEVCISTNESVGGLLSRISDEGINLHWGGNATKLINWIDFGRYSREGIASKILNAAFFNCLNDKSLAEKAIRPGTLAQLQSPGHKSEAAGGLVVMDLGSPIISGESSSVEEDEYAMPDEDSNTQNRYAGVICGENIELKDGNKILFYEPITNTSLFEENNQTRFKATSLERLKRFIDILNFIGIKNGLFSEDTKIFLNENELSLIRKGVEKEFIRMQSLMEGQRLIEPIFIMEIKLVLEIIISKMT